MVVWGLEFGVFSSPFFESEAEIFFSSGLTIAFLDVCSLSERSVSTGGEMAALLVSESSAGGRPEATEGLNGSLGFLDLSSDLGGRETM